LLVVLREKVHRSRSSGECNFALVVQDGTFTNE